MPTPETIDHFELDSSVDQVVWVPVNHAIPAADRAIDEPLAPGVLYWRLTGVTNLGNRFEYNIVTTNVTANRFAWNRFQQNLEQYKTTVANSVAVSIDGSIYVIGAFQGQTSFNPPSSNVLTSADAASDVFLVKYNSAGVFQWAQRFGALLDDKAFAVTTDSTGKVIVAGIYSSNSVNFGGGNLPFQGNNDAFIAKFNPDGTYVWSRGIGETSVDSIFGIAVDSTDAIWVGGGVGFGTVDFGAPVGNISGVGSQNSFIFKLSSAGASVYARRLSQAAGQFGDSNVLKGLAVDSADNVVIGGYFTGTVNFGGGARTAANAAGVLYLAKYNSSGAYQWDRVWASTGFTGVYGVAIDRGDSNAIVITGPLAGSIPEGIGNGAPVSTAGGTGLHVVRYSSANAYVWHKLYGGNPSQTDNGNGISVSSAGDISVAGNMQSILAFGGGWLFGNGAVNMVVLNIGRTQEEKWAKRIFTASAIGVASVAAKTFVTGSATSGTDFGGGALSAVAGQHGFVVAYNN